jgi:hypothetical protein
MEILYKDCYPTIPSVLNGNSAELNKEKIIVNQSNDNK